jgi:hypothetical protein
VAERAGRDERPPRLDLQHVGLWTGAEFGQAPGNRILGAGRRVADHAGTREIGRLCDLGVVGDDDDSPGTDAFECARDRPGDERPVSDASEGAAWHFWRVGPSGDYNPGIRTHVPSLGIRARENPE